jgi:hypothetical protein
MASDAPAVVLADPALIRAPDRLGDTIPDIRTDGAPDVMRATAPTMQPTLICSR